MDDRSAKPVAPAAGCRIRAIPFSVAHSILPRNLRTCLSFPRPRQSAAPTHRSLRTCDFHDHTATTTTFVFVLQPGAQDIHSFTGRHCLSLRKRPTAAAALHLLYLDFRLTRAYDPSRLTEPINRRNVFRIPRLHLNLGLGQLPSHSNERTSACIRHLNRASSHPSTMRLSGSLLVLAATTFSSTSLAASLSDFKPRVNNLPSNCQTVYTAAIAGCSGSDFSGTCSFGCIKGLQAMTAFVQAACQGISFQNTNLISVFLSGMGPASLCPNLQAQASNASPTTTAQNTQASSAATSAATTSPSTTSSAATGTTSSSNASTNTASSSSTTTSTGSTSANTSATTTTSGQISMQTSSAASPQASSQCVSRGGGGSPFDISGTQCSSARSLSIWTGSTMLLAAMAVLVGL